MGVEPLYFQNLAASAADTSGPSNTAFLTTGAEGWVQGQAPGDDGGLVAGSLNPEACSRAVATVAGGVAQGMPAWQANNATIAICPSIRQALLQRAWTYAGAPVVRAFGGRSADNCLLWRVVGLMVASLAYALIGGRKA